MRSLEQLARDILVALERPEDGFVFDDFDRRYTAAERKREKDAAAWYYRDKTSFETKYDAETDGHDEPSWVSDAGRGEFELESVVSYVLDGTPKDPRWLVLWRKKRRQLKPKHRAILDALGINWQTAAAARIAGSTRPTVDNCKKIFKMHFAQCHTAWKRDFAF